MLNPTSREIATQTKDCQRRWGKPCTHKVDDPARALAEQYMEQCACDVAALNREYYKFLAALKVVWRLWIFLGGKVPDASGSDSTWISEALSVDEEWLREQVSKHITPDLRGTMGRQTAGNVLLALESIHRSALDLRAALTENMEAKT